MLMPDDRIVTVDVIPEWYWLTAERIVAHVESFMKGDIMVFSYFTCEEEDDGTLFHTVYSLPDAPGEWTVIARSRTLREAQEKQANIRAAWWIGADDQRLPNPEDDFQVPLLGFTVPRHPLAPD
ncbi:hypothetical protein GCM10008957_27050 [Deinococcus ruber]|uniref:Uncharacterized protein n=2 Tax=Deinococcus ruber TaxID=1848197 RepID=A0A918CBD6_9DEIO|nr:hypothetical protein GCM10008957_27050 [Deinococcus ruber]